MHKTYNLTPLKYLTNYEKEIALAWKYKIFRLRHDTNNEYDNFAIIVQKQVKDTWVKVGYVQKFNYQTKWTKEAEELYYLAQSGEISWEEAQCNENWGAIECIEKTPMFDNTELELLLKTYSDYKLLTDRVSSEEWTLYLVSTESI